jgi:hypothetical protein
MPDETQEEIVSQNDVDVDTLLETEVKLISFGDAVKALGDGKVAGYLVRFGDETTPDLTGDFFTKETDFGDVTHTAVYYQHGLDRKMGKRKLAKGDMREDDVGVWIEAQLNMRDEYEKAIYAMVEQGKMGWSSGTAPHLVEREEKGKAHFIKTWPLGLDASLTPTPAEPRNEVITLKSFMGDLQKLAEPAEVEGAGDAPPVAGDAPETDQPTIKETTIMTELTQEQLDTLLAEAGKAGADAAMKSLPAINNAGVQVVHDPADNPFKDFGEQLAAVKTATLTQGRDIDVRLTRLNIKQLGANELIGSEGGFLLEPSFVAELLKPLHDAGPFSSRAAKLSIGPNANGITVRAVDETSRATGSRDRKSVV